MSKKKMPQDVYETVMERSGGACEAMIFPACTGQPVHWHHRKMRSQGGGHEIQNGLAICDICHRHIHNNPAESYRLGFLVKSMKDPGEVTVARRGRIVLLDSEGGFKINEEGG